MNKSEMAKALKHLDWAEPHPTKANCVLVDPDKMYPAYFAELGGEHHRYWLEVAFHCMKMDLQVALKKFGFEIHVRADDGRKLRWSHRTAPGTAKEYNPKTDPDVLRATQGKEARAHFKRIRGYLPS